MPLATDFNFSAGSLDAEALRVLRFTGAEAISQCFVYDLELGPFEPPLAFEEMIC